MPKEGLDSRPSTPERLGVTDVPPQLVLGRGSHGVVKLGKSRMHKPVAIKLPIDATRNTKQRYEFCFRKAIYKALLECNQDTVVGQKGEMDLTPDIPVVECYSITVSNKFFSTKDCGSPVVFTMEKMDGTFDKLPERKIRLQRRLINNTIKVLSGMGFIMSDMKDENIFIKDDKAYIGDCGECRIKCGTKAEEYFNAIVKEFGFNKSEFSDNLEADISDFFLGSSI